MKEEISKLNNTVFNLNSEVLTVKSSLKKTEDEHAKTKELLSQRNSFLSSHALIVDDDERIQDVQIEEFEGSQDEIQSDEQHDNDEEEQNTRIAELIQFERLQAEKEELQNLNEMYLNKIQRLEVDLAA